MSKYGEVTVNVYAHYTVEQLTAFAAAHKITFEKAKSLAKEILYRKAYNTLRNKSVDVKAKRHAYNKQRQELLKSLR